MHRTIIKIVLLLLCLSYSVYAQKPVRGYTLTPKDLSPPIDYKEVTLHTEDGLKLKGCCYQNEMLKEQ